MKSIVACVFTNTGIAKASGNPYSMTRALVLVPFSGTETANFQSRGDGFKAVELSVSSAFAEPLHNHWLSTFKGQPVVLDLSLSMDSEGKNIVTGFEKAA
jgi:hypothetical protein